MTDAMHASKRVTLRRALDVFATLACVTACALLFFKAWSMSADSDIFWQLATGREIMMNGVPRQNVFTDTSLGYGIVCQQWLWCVMSWLLYNAFGWTSLRVLCVVECACVLLLVKILAKVQMGRVDVLWHKLAIAAAALALIAHATWRPHLMTVMLVLCSVIALERWRRGGSCALLAVPVAVTIVHANVHGALALVQLAVMLLYTLPLPWRAYDRIMTTPRRRAQLLVATCAVALALGLTPYGWESALVGVSSIVGVPWFVSMSVQELRPMFMTDSPLLAAIYSFEIILCVSPAVCKMLRWRSIGSREGRYGYDGVTVVIVIAACVYAMMHMRMLMMFAVAAPFAVARLSADSSEIARHAEDMWRMSRAGQAIAMALVTAVAGLAFVTASSTVSSVAADELSSRGEELASGRHEIAKAYNAVVDAGADVTSDLLFTTFNTGGYGEFLGFKVTLDARQELWYGDICSNDDPLFAEMRGMFGDESQLDWLVRRVPWAYAIVDTVSESADDGSLSPNSLLAKHIDSFGATRIYESDDGDVVVWKAPDPWPADAQLTPRPKQ